MKWIDWNRFKIDSIWAGLSVEGMNLVQSGLKPDYFAILMLFSCYFDTSMLLPLSCYIAAVIYTACHCHATLPLPYCFATRADLPLLYSFSSLSACLPCATLLLAYLVLHCCCNVTLPLSCYFATLAALSLAYRFADHAFPQFHTTSWLSCCFPLSWYFATVMLPAPLMLLCCCHAMPLVSYCFTTVMLLCHCHAALASYASCHSYASLLLSYCFATVMPFYHSCCSATVILLFQPCFLPVSCYFTHIMLLATVMVPCVCSMSWMKSKW